MNARTTSRAARVAAVLVAVLAAVGVLVLPQVPQASAAVTPLSNTTSLVAGHSHVCARATNSTVTCWGANRNGQLGTGDQRVRTVPTTVAGLGSATQLAAGNAHTCALILGGTVKCWGDNTYGQAGTAASAQSVTTPTTVTGLSSISSIYAGNATNCAIDTIGKVWCWGANVAQIVKSGTENPQPTPQQISGVTGAKELAIGLGHICARMTDATLKCWGDAEYGALGNGAVDKPAGSSVNPGLTGVESVHAGAWHTCAIKGGVIDDSLYCWGRNDFGQVSTTAGNKTTPQLVTGVSPLQIDLGPETSCARKSGGSITCFGQIQGIPNAITQASSLAVNYWGGCALVTTTVRCWGFAGYGTLGNGSIDTSANATVATPAAALTPVAPVRLLDTRPSGSTVDGVGARGGKVAGRSVTTVQVTGRGTVPSGAASAVLTVTASGAGAAGAVTVYPCGVARPVATHLMLPVSAARTNTGIFGLSATGTVCVWSRRSVHLVVSVGGYAGAISGPTTVTPARLLDTRSTGSTIDDQFEGVGKLAAGATTEFGVRGRGGVSPGATEVVLDLTSTGAVAPGEVVVDDCSGVAGIVHMAVAPGQPASNMVIVPVSAEGTVCVRSTVATDLTVDVLANFTASNAYRSAAAVEIVDTRPDGTTTDEEFEATGLVAAGAVNRYPMADRGLSEVRAPRTVVVPVTVSGATATGTVTVWACGTARPTVAQISVTAGVARSATVVVAVGDREEICLRSSTAVFVRIAAMGFYTY